MFTVAEEVVQSKILTTTLPAENLTTGIFFSTKLNHGIPPVKVESNFSIFKNYFIFGASILIIFSFAVYIIAIADFNFTANRNNNKYMFDP